MDVTSSAPAGAAASTATPATGPRPAGIGQAPGRSGGGGVELIGLCKNYDEVPAVRGIDVSIAAGEFFSLLGPSG